MVNNVFWKLIVCVIFITISTSFLCMPETYALGTIFEQGKNFLEITTSAERDIVTVINLWTLRDTSNNIYNILLAIAVMVAIVVGMILGIQFMVSTVDGKAQVKEALIPFVIGCIVVFGAFTIWKIIILLGNKAESTIATTTIFYNVSERV